MMPVRRLMQRLESLSIPEPPPLSEGVKPAVGSSVALGQVSGHGHRGVKRSHWIKSNVMSTSEVEALLKNDLVTKDDLTAALSTTKPSSDGNISRYFF